MSKNKKKTDIFTWVQLNKIKFTMLLLKKFIVDFI